MVLGIRIHCRNDDVRVDLNLVIIAEKLDQLGSNISVAFIDEYLVLVFLRGGLVVLRLSWTTGFLVGGLCAVLWLFLVHRV